jgi:hypothetical protein
MSVGYPSESASQLSNQPYTGYDAMSSDHQREVMTAFANKIGTYGDLMQYNKNYNYAMIMTQLLPIRNNSVSDITVTANWTHTNQYGSYNGSQVILVTPTNSSGTQYSTVKGWNISSLRAYTGGDFNSRLESNMTMTIPAGKTCLLIGSATCRSVSSYTAHGLNYFYQLDTLFANSAIQCDLRVVHAIRQTDWHSRGWTRHLGSTYGIAGGADATQIWKAAAELYGDR